MGRADTEVRRSLARPSNLERNALAAGDDLKPFVIRAGSRMTPVEPTIWPLDPHGRAKHYILRSHLNGWLPIMTRSFRKLLYIDGFAGPGIYEGGEPGSPVIALRAAMFHHQLVKNPPACELGFLFIEERADR